MRILFFIESLRCGGKERRLLELIQYLKENTGYEMILVLTENKIQYPHIYELGVPIKVIKRKYLKRDPMLFYRFYKLCNEVKPDIIHTWGSMLAFYSLPFVIFKNIPHINSHITNVPLHRKKSGFQYLITNLGFKFSDIILANSYSGLKSYGVSGKKCRVIYNGIRLDRFSNLADKEIVKKEIAALTVSGPGEKWNIQLRVTGIDTGIFRWLELTGHVDYENNKPVRIIGTAIDITERKAGEEEKNHRRRVHRRL